MMNRIIYALMISAAIALSTIAAAGEVTKSTAIITGVEDGNGTAKTETPEGVSEESVENDDAVHIPNVIVTATKTDAPSEYSPFTMHTVDREDIDSQADHLRPNFGELIQDLPGVLVSQSTYKPAAWITLRGTGDFFSRTLYLVDGLPVGSSTMMTNTFNSNDIERVDVVLGPSSALYGSNAAGGVVNIITRKGKKDTGGTVTYGFGSNNTNRLYMSVGDEVEIDGNTINYYFSYATDDSDGFKTTPIENALAIYEKSPSALTTATVEDADNSGRYFSGKVGWTWANGADLTIGYNYANLVANGGQPNLILVDDGEQGVGNFRFQLPIGNFMKIAFTGGYQYWDRPSKTNKGLSNTGSTLQLDESRKYANESKVKRTPFELQGDMYLGGNNVLTAGLFYSDEKIEAERSDWSTGALKSASEYNTEQKAAYLQDEMFFLDEKLSVLLGIRYDHWEYYDIYDSSSTQKYPDDYDNECVTYRGGIKYRFNDRFTLKSSAGTAYYPGLATWFFQNITTGSTWREANLDLKPEKTWMVDLGLEGRFASTGTSFSVTPYYGNISDVMSGGYYPHPTLSGVSVIRYKNVGEAEIYGIEAQVNQRITDHMTAFVNLTLNHSEIVKDPANKGNQMAFSPDFMGSLGIKYQNPSFINASFVLRGSSSMYYDNENTDLPYYHSDSYDTMDAKIWRDWKLNRLMTLKAALSIENILDKDFAPLFVYENPGRTMQLNVSVNYAF